MFARDLLKRISELKSKGQKIYSNCFLNFNTNMEFEWQVVYDKHTIIILKPEYSYHRLWYYTNNIQEFLALQATLSSGEYILEIVSKNRNELKKELLSSGFVEIADMQRLSTNNYYNLQNTIKIETSNRIHGHVANVADLFRIKELLFNTFDARVAHFVDDCLLKDVIQSGSIVIHEDNEGNIKTLLQFEKNLKSFYVNQIINLQDSMCIHSILQDELEKYYQEGGKYVYAWVNKDNIASQKFFAKYGLVHDGLWSVVYSKVQ